MADRERPESTDDRDSRTRLLLGNKALGRLRRSRVLVVGAGGVGGYSIEMLARTSVGHLTIVDADVVSPSNLNRQIIALESTKGRSKVSVFRERISEINPDIMVETFDMFLTPENVGPLLDKGFDYVIDAIDTVRPKVALLAECLRRGVNVISSMGAGGRVDPSKVIYCDLWETREDGLARAVRQGLKKMGLKKKLTVVSSTESPAASSLIELNQQNKRSSLGTIAPIPSLFGIFLASKVIKDLISHN